MKNRNEPVNLSPRYSPVLERFAYGEVSLDGMHSALSAMFGTPLRQSQTMRWFPLGSIAPEGCILITRGHLECVLARRRQRHISEQGLIDWATMILINEAFSWDSNDKVLTEWINNLTLDFSVED